MSNGILGKALSAANNNITVYTVPSAIQYATVTIVACNIGPNPSKIKIAIGLTDVPGSADYIEYNTTLAAEGGYVEHSCIPVSPNEKVVVWAETDAVAIRVHGLEQA